MFPRTKKAFRSNRDLHRTLRAISAIVFVAGFTFCLLGVAADRPSGKPQIQGANLRVEFDNRLRSRVIARFDTKETVLGAFTASETLTTTGKVWTEFPLTSQKQDRVKDAFGQGTRLTVEGKAGTLTKRVAVTVYDDFPAMAFFNVQYTNTGKTELTIKSWTNNAYTLDAQPDGGQPEFWSYQSGSYEKRPNWVLPLHTSFEQENYQGMNAADYGGGTPIVDIWRRDVGMAVGHVETRPKLVSLPVSMPDPAHAKMAVRFTYVSHLRCRAPGRLLPHARRLPPFHGETRLPNGLCSHRWLRRNLVRVGIRPISTAEAGI
jgi:alpha-galactosidase